VIALIVAAEIAFWLTLLFGLVARYLLRRPRLAIDFLISFSYTLWPRPEVKNLPG
jgi:hypothetical protein